jgi:sigma-B regulation protein RsbU (phosphoserine phosphatase)
VVADVEGKGVSSAMVMSNLQATLRALVMHLHSLEVITLSLNEMILADTRSGKFLSAFLGLIDTERRGLHYINAGHVPPLLVRRTGEVLSLEEGGMVIGLFNAVEYDRGSVKLMAGDVLAFCTDGIMEAANTDEDEFGAERLADAIRRHRDLPADELVREVVKEVTEYARGGPHIDDKVLMVVKVLDYPDPTLTTTVH